MGVMVNGKPIASASASGQPDVENAADAAAQPVLPPVDPAEFKRLDVQRRQCLAQVQHALASLKHCGTSEHRARLEALLAIAETELATAWDGLPSPTPAPAPAPAPALTPGADLGDGWVLKNVGGLLIPHKSNPQKVSTPITYIKHPPKVTIPKKITYLKG